MQIKIFGKQLFEFNKSGFGEIRYNTALDTINKSKYLPDFYKDTGNRLFDYAEEGSVWTLNPGVATIAGSSTNNNVAVAIKKEEKKAEKEISPKEVYNLKTLNDGDFKIKTDPNYVDMQIKHFKDKLGMIKSQEYDMNRGTVEIGSILKRMENRKKYSKFEKFYSEFPYTQTEKISKLVKEHSHLKLGQVSQFLADMPQEAVDVMKRYTKETKALCDKEPVYYIIANKKDFEKTEKRRDPILLAQSPFGHFWQVLGAWDEEMILIEEL